MEKYLKMSDMFGAAGVKVRGSNGRHIMCDDILVANCFCTDSANYTAHAINSHDELVEEVERLRLMISECYPYIKDKADWGNKYEVDLANRLFDASM